jgi:hypothetical protein
MQEDTTESLKDAIRVDADQLRTHIDEAVRTRPSALTLSSDITLILVRWRK